jgi:hypothetical protein
VGPKQLGASGVLYILDLRHRIKVDSVVAGNANQFDRVFFTIAAGTFVATAMWFLQFCVLFFIFVRLCRALRHSGAVLPIVTGCLVYLGVTALFVVGLFATSSIPSALPPPDALTGRGFSCFRNSCGVALRVGQVGGSTGIACSYGCPRGTVCNVATGEQYCYFSLAFGTVMLGPGGSYHAAFGSPPWPPHVSAEGPDGSEVEKHPVFQWSGAIYGSGVWSYDEVCGWTDAIPFGNCKDAIDGPTGTIEALFQCNSPFDVSCFQKGAGPACCGCSTWDDFVPVASHACQSTNPLWTQYAQPHLEVLKRACPTCYTYPYDDPTSTFTCWNDATLNEMSYEIEWCPGGAAITVT